MISKSESELRNRVYSRLIDLLELSPNHHEDLIKRGLNKKTIITNEYRTLPRNFAERRAISNTLHDEFKDALFEVPGFYSDVTGDLQEVPMMKSSKALLIPLRTKDRKINSFYLRRDEIKGRGKYIHFNHSGTVELNLKPHWPKNVKNTNSVILTEGPLKADITSQYLNKLTLALPGVTMWKMFVDILEHGCFDEIVIANDNDLERKQSVLIATANLARHCLQNNLNLKIATWDRNFKGIDDALLGGSDIAYIDSTKSKEYIDKAFQRNGLREVNWDGSGNIQLQPHERKWKELLPLPDSKVVSPDFKEQLLPRPLKIWVQDTAERMQAPPEYLIASAILTLAGLLGRGIVINPKTFDPWYVIANLWGAIVGPPSALKSPSLRAARQPLDKYSNKLNEEYEVAKIAWKAEEATSAAQKKAIEEKIKKGHGKLSNSQIDALKKRDSKTGHEACIEQTKAP